MAYQIGQINLPEGNNTFMKSSTLTLTPDKIDALKDKNNGNFLSIDNINFYDICFKGSYVQDTSYYFYCKIKRTIEEQKFDVYLTNEDSQQYIKTVTIAASDGKNGVWASCEVLFSPIAALSSLLFRLQRTSKDFIEPRTSTIICVSFKEFENVQDLFTENYTVVKVGIQSRPGYRVLINGEEIYVGRTGIYEYSHSAIQINSLSIVSQPIIEDDDSLNDLTEGEGYVKLDMETENKMTRCTIDYMQKGGS